MNRINENNEKIPIDESVTIAVKYCVENGILKEFLEKHGSEVINMLFEEITIEEIADIRYGEGFSEGRGERDREIARNLLIKGSTLEFVHEITGLDIKNIQELAGQNC